VEKIKIFCEKISCFIVFWRARQGDPSEN